MRSRSMQKNIIILVGVTLLAGCVGHRVPRPRSDADFTYKIGWWPYQNDLRVKSFTTEIVNSHLYILNSTSLIRMHIGGEIKGPKQWRPQINKVHISEQVLHGGNFTNSLAEIHITPIIDVKQDKNYQGEIIKFRINQELHIKSMGWGSNTYRIICGSYTNELDLLQMK